MFTSVQLGLLASTVLRVLLLCRSELHASSAAIVVAPDAEKNDRGVAGSSSPPKFTMYNNVTVPMVGLGSASGVRYHHVASAIEAGYRFVDTAQSANMQYNTCKSQFEITFDQNSEIQLDETGPANDIREHYEFVKIDRLESVEPNAYVDILAVVKHVGETTSIVSKKSGKELVKCELTIEDDSGAEVRLTMWGDVAQAAQGKFGGMPVVAFKRARVSDYGGRTLSGSGYEVNPSIPQAQSLSR